MFQVSYDFHSKNSSEYDFNEFNIETHQITYETKMQILW